jgi:hypothetical protein
VPGIWGAGGRGAKRVGKRGRSYLVNSDQQSRQLSFHPTDVNCAEKSKFVPRTLCLTQVNSFGQPEHG